MAKTIEGQTAPPRRFEAVRKPAILGVLAALTSVAAYGIGQIITRVLVTSAAPPQVGASLTVFFGMMCLFLFSLGNLQKDLKAPKTALGSALLSGTLSSIAVLAVFFAFSKAPVVIVAPITSISPLIALVLSVIFLRQMEHITPRLIIGSLLVVGGVILVVVGSNL